MKLNRFLFISGTLLAVAGGAAGIAGYNGVSLFLAGYDNTQPLTTFDLVKGLIMPHVFMLFGVGMIAFGIIMIVRGFFFKKRLESYNK